MKNLFRIKQENSHYFVFWTIIILLIIQIFFITFTLEKQMDNDYQTLVSSSVQKQIYADEESLANLTHILRYIADNSQVIRYFNEPAQSAASYMQLTSALRSSVLIINEPIENLYLYHSDTQMMLSLSGSYQPLDQMHLPDLKENLMAEPSQRKSYLPFLQIHENTLFSRQEKLFYCYWPDLSTKDAIVLELDYNLYNRTYTQLQNTVNGELLVVTNDGQVIFGGSSFPIGTDLSTSPVFTNAKSYKSQAGHDPIKNGQHLYFYSNTCSFWYITHRSAKDFLLFRVLNKNYIYLYISLGLSVLLIFRMYNWFPKIVLFFQKGLQRVRSYTGNQNHAKRFKRIHLRPDSRKAAHVYLPAG